MTGNTFGKLFRVTTFGESHGEAIGCIVDGCPSGFELSEKDIQKELDRRRPGQSFLTTQRSEPDQVQILSGIFDGKTLGTPICLLVKNKDARSKDYEDLKNVYRPGHADLVYEKKYGIRDYRGGGRASARETVARVMAGAIAKKFLREKLKLEVLACVSKVGEIEAVIDLEKVTFEQIEKNNVRCPDEETAKKMEALILAAKKSGNSVGGAISCMAKNVPMGLGEPVFDKLEAVLGQACLSIPACWKFEVLGGISGGISNGESIFLRVEFKAPASTPNNLKKLGKEIPVGRHDPCVLPRAVPVVEAMVAMTLMDHFLRDQAQNFKNKK